HGDKREHVIVLVHGLTDSPYFMRAIGRYFHQKLGFNVVIPLLQTHGLKEPNGMKGVSLEEWKKNVAFAVKEATKRGNHVSIGGLSTGGALSVYQAMKEPNSITGGVFLFSAAIDLAGRTGDLFERLLRTPVASVLDYREDSGGQPLVGDNPYRYSRMDKGGARQLSRLIKEVDNLTEEKWDDREKAPLQPLFVAHSEADAAANIQGATSLLEAKAKNAEKTGSENQSRFFRIAKGFNVSHASVVLQEPVFAKNGSPLEPANPFFDNMMRSAGEVAREYLGV
ncbi:MAG: hypothetical protein F6K09_30090, partial [Merismopedia sp. SIO2A8]|nr:hypothetical protein [Merismopedia sp. SIO2A8]